MFDDALFHLLQPVVITIQDFLGMGKIEIILAVFVPRQIDDRLYILRLDGKIRRLRMQTFQLAHFLFKRFGYRRRPFFLGSLFAQFLYLQLVDIAPQLFLDGLDLLLEKIFLLLLVNILVRLHLDGCFQFHQLILPIQDEQKTVRSVFQVTDQQQILFFRRSVGNIATRKIDQVKNIFIIPY